MNILPKKSWHVRNKDNIERVRRDEAKAAEEEKEKQRKVALAESEARTEFLRSKSRKNSAVEAKVEEKSVVAKEIYSHVNLFQDLDGGAKKEKKGNEEYEKEKKEEKEKYEKQIGLLTYLGQSSIAAQNETPWWMKSKEDKKEASENKVRDEFSAKTKRLLDPMKDMCKYVDEKNRAEHQQKGIDIKCEKYKKHDEYMRKKRQKLAEKSVSKEKASSSSTKTIEQLRAQRLRREKEERAKAEKLLAKMRGEKVEEKTEELDERQRGYHSQFNPDCVRVKKRKRNDYHQY
ncbi:hypothetical protein CAPTEDRAFT_212153 [Capitella teleta]|uniref:CBF1-interacting co-repressor CIR N-terminal domain-containing protein n=1 Tax=Capitella teleta TaxID=283909 RepID=R7UJB7_CAPTE|nr:hypothetical protein CAPTEDRAFT_212153 [Capitella teleta]|eukprot:ELU06183.1 hypothetical protein CAPTEDRAFT_212153 [Capitella teleta]